MDSAWTLVTTKEHLEDRLVVMMGGWAATMLLRDGQEDSGIEQDFKDATQLALVMVTRFGMSEVGVCNIEVLRQSGLLSDALMRDVTNAVNKLLEWAKHEALALLKEHMDDLKRLVEAIGEHETLSKKTSSACSCRDTAIGKSAKTAAPPNTRVL